MAPNFAAAHARGLSPKAQLLLARHRRPGHGSGHQGDMTKVHQHPLETTLDSRIAIIDGAMGTTIRTYGMTEADIRGQRFKDSTKSLLNNGDLFSLTKPEMIGDIHRRFLRQGPTSSRQNPSGPTAST